MEKFNFYSVAICMLILLLSGISVNSYTITNNTQVEFGQSCNNHSITCKSRSVCIPEGFCANGGALERSFRARHDQLCHLRKSGTFLEWGTGLCKCYLNAPCGDSNLCPLHSSPRKINNVTSCNCNADHSYQVWASKECIQGKSYSQACEWKADGWIDPCLQGTHCGIDNNCTCYNHTEYWDPFLTKCVAKRINCGSSGNGVCGRHQVCGASRQCECESGYVPNFEERCVGLYKSPCEITNDCAGGALDCIGKVCDFESLASKCSYYDLIYDEKVGKCIVKIDKRGLYGINCNSTEFQCGLDTEKTRCDDDVVCGCKQGLLPTANKLDCVQGKDYGEHCDQDRVPCNEKFECSTAGICTCRNGGIFNNSDSLCYSNEVCQERYLGTFYEVGSGSCKCLVGQICNMSSLENGTLYCPLHSTTKIQPLIPNYKLLNMEQHHSDATCTCEDGYTVNPNNTACFKAKSFGETCDDALEIFCDSHSGTSCINGICSCNLITQLWDQFQKKCKLRIGERCGEGVQFECTRNSVCSYSPSDTLHEGNTECVCDPMSHSRSYDGWCFSNYGARCLLEADCETGLACVDDFCTCSEMAGHIYNENIKKCIGQVGSVCIKPGENTTNVGKCVEDSYCDHVTGICTCDPGFRTLGPIRDRCFEVAKYGEACSVSLHTCDFTKGIACNNLKCSCVDSRLTYVDEKVGCVAPIGYKCGDYKKLDVCSNLNNGCDYFYSVDCAEGGTCENIGKDGKYNYVCQEISNRNANITGGVAGTMLNK